MTLFSELGVAPPVVSALEERGIQSAFPIQELAIPDALAGRDVCGKAKTGSGKTLAFGIPTIQALDRAERGTLHALMLVPTRELATQVVDELAPLAKSLNLRALAIYGGADMDKQINKLNTFDRSEFRYFELPFSQSSRLVKNNGFDSSGCFDMRYIFYQHS